MLNGALKGDVPGQGTLLPEHLDDYVVADNLVIEEYMAANNAFDVSGSLKFLLPEVSFENSSAVGLTAGASGVDEFKQLAEQAEVMFSNANSPLRPSNKVPTRSS